MLDIIVSLIFLVAIGGALYGIYYLIDTVNQPEHTSSGVVCEKEFIERHMIFIYSAATKTSMPHWIPDAWHINVRVSGEELDGLEINEDLYNSIEIGETVLAAIRVGRLSGKNYLFGVTKA